MRTMCPPTAGRESDFERAYGPAGEWAERNSRADGCLGTELLRRSDNQGEYLTLDRWTSRPSYEAFRSRWSDEYGRLDRRLEGLTEEEAPSAPSRCSIRKLAPPRRRAVLLAPIHPTS
jgi:heme-degrading monooxygenase HmoA